MGGRGGIGVMMTNGNVKKAFDAKEKMRQQKFCPTVDNYYAPTFGENNVN